MIEVAAVDVSRNVKSALFPTVKTASPAEALFSKNSLAPKFMPASMLKSGLLPEVFTMPSPLRLTVVELRKLKV